MSDPAQPTLFTIKKSFLASQIRLLSVDPTPPPNWQDDIPAGPGGDLSQRAIDQALTKVNLVARKYNRSVYSSQTVKRVAEQIEAIYAGAVENEGGGGGGGEVPGGEEVLRRGLDLTDVEYVVPGPHRHQLTHRVLPLARWTPTVLCSFTLRSTQIEIADD